MTLRRALIVATLCAWHSTVVAQITVTSATFPVVGDAFKSARPVSLPPFGTFYTPPAFNVHWDASSLLPGQRIQTLFRSPSTGVYSANFPAANMMTGNGIAETYYRTSLGKVEVLGVAGNARGAPTDTFGVGWVATFTPPFIERPATIDFFDIRQNAIQGFVSLPAGNALPESLRSITSDYPTLDAWRIRFNYSATDTVDAFGDLKVPGAAAPVAVLRIKRSFAVEVSLQGRYYDPNLLPLWGQVFQAHRLTWDKCTTIECGFLPGPDPSAAWISFLNTIKGQLDAHVEGLNGDGGLIQNDFIDGAGASPWYDVYLFRSATDKEELAIARSNNPQRDAWVSVGFKDLNPPAPSLRIARDASGVGVYWPAASTGWFLQSAGNLISPNWQPASGTSTQVGDELRFPVDLGGPSKFFRLARP